VHDSNFGVSARIFRRFIDFPRLGLLIIVVMSALSMGGYFYPQWPGDIKRWIMQEKAESVQDEGWRNTQQSRRSSRTRNIARESFGNSHAVVVIKTNDLFTMQGAAAYRRIVEKLNELDVVSFARSIDESPPLNIFGLTEPVLPVGQASEQRFAAAKAKALRNPLIVGFTLSPDAKTVLIEVVYNFIFVQESEDLTKQLIETAKSAAAEYPDVQMDISVTGAVPFYDLVQRNNRSNERLYQLIGYSMILTMAFILFRGIVVVIVVSLAPIAGVMWTLGTLRYFGLEDNPFSFVILPVLLSLVGFTDGVHMMVHIRAKLQQGFTPRQACKQTLEQVGLACFLTSLTTAVGMGSLLFAHHEVVREFGLSCVIGVVCTWVSVMLIIPLACQTRFGYRLAKSTHRDFMDRSLDRLGPMVRFCLHHNRVITLGAIVVMMVFGGAASTLKPDDRKSSALPEGNEIRTALDHLDKSMGGLDVCRVNVSWREANRSESDVVNLLTKIDDLLNQEQLIGHPLSLPRLLEALPGEGSAIDKVSMIDLLPPPLKLTLYDPENRSAAVLFRVQDLGSATYAPTFERLEKSFAALTDEQTTIRMEGDPIWRWRDLFRIVTDLVVSLGSASLVIFVILGIAFRSIRLGLISVIPNIMPLLAAAAWMAINQQPLEIVSVCCFTICLGIAVDDTIHFLSRYKLELNLTTDIGEAIEKAFKEVGSGLIMTTIVLVAGFGSVIFSDTKDYRVFGSLGMITLLTALLCDLFLLPPLLKSFDRPSTKKE
jgi:predicted RND superfamily exporter protein